MDALFHAASACLLAHLLGQRRLAGLLLAGLVGIFPDLLWGAGQLLGIPGWDYARCHSLLLCGLVTGIILTLRWRVALGLPLHILVDTPLHRASPLYRGLGLRGIDWWQGAGIPIAVLLWLMLLILAAAYVKASRRRAASVRLRLQGG